MTLGAIPADHLACRAERHTWQRERWVVTDGHDGWTAPFGMSGAIGRLFTCSTCGSQRVRWYDRRGRAIYRYRPAAGYRWTRPADDPDAIAPTPADYREALAAELWRQVDDAARRPRRKRAGS